MPVSHTLDRLQVAFDEERLVANGGLLLRSTLAEHLGVRDLVDQLVDLGDAVSLSPDGARVNLIIAQTTEWDGSDRLFEFLQQKLLNYLGFAPDGQLERAFPEVAGKPWAIVLHCQTEPDERTTGHLQEVAEPIRRCGGTVEIHRICEGST